MPKNGTQPEEFMVASLEPLGQAPLYSVWRCPPKQKGGQVSYSVRGPGFSVGTGWRRDALIMEGMDDYNVAYLLILQLFTAYKAGHAGAAVPGVR